MIEEIFYITGRGGLIHDGLGEFLMSRAREVTGISLTSQFLSTPFERQVEAIQSKLPRLEAAITPIIANSYGAYLLLHSMIAQPPLKTKVMLLSPVVGTLVSEIGYFKPPYADRIPGALADGVLVKPEWFEVYVGSRDNQCDLVGIQGLVSTMKADRFSVVDDQGHMIHKEVVAGLVDGFLGG